MGNIASVNTCSSTIISEVSAIQFCNLVNSCDVVKVVLYAHCHVVRCYLIYSLKLLNNNRLVRVVDHTSYNLVFDQVIKGGWPQNNFV